MNIAFPSSAKWVFHGPQIHETPPLSPVLNGLNPREGNPPLHIISHFYFDHVYMVGGVTRLGEGNPVNRGRILACKRLKVG